jgi:hypothetical protein
MRVSLQRATGRIVQKVNVKMRIREVKIGKGPGIAREV